MKIKLFLGIMAIKCEIIDAKFNYSPNQKAITFKNSFDILKKYRGKQGIKARREKQKDEKKIYR